MALLPIKNFKGARKDGQTTTQQLKLVNNGTFFTMTQKFQVKLI